MGAGGTHQKTINSWQNYLGHLPTKDGFKALISQVKEVCRAEIDTVRQDLKQMAERVDALEKEHDSMRWYLSQLQMNVTFQAKLLHYTCLHLEDIDNWGWRNYIRVRGLPKATWKDSLWVLLEPIFKQILEEPLPYLVKLDRAHRAVCPKRPSSPPRNVTCCLYDFGLEERIMALWDIAFEGSTLQLYPDLYWMTLHRRCQLKPLVSLLRAQNISYRWGFPFSLVVSENGRLAMLCSHADLATLCSTIDIEPPNLLDWEMELPLLAPPQVWQRTQQKRKRALSSGSPCHLRSDLVQVVDFLLYLESCGALICKFPP